MPKTTNSANIQPADPAAIPDDLPSSVYTDPVVEEVWLPLVHPNVRDGYLVSNHGRVFYTVGSPRRPPALVKVDQSKRTGVVRARLRGPYGGVNRIIVAECVLHTFQGPPPDVRKKFARHRDKDPGNLQQNNLKWGRVDPNPLPGDSATRVV